MISADKTNSGRPPRYDSVVAGTTRLRMERRSASPGGGLLELIVRALLLLVTGGIFLIGVRSILR